MKKSRRVNCTCEICGKSFEKVLSDIALGRGKFCSVECYRKAQKLRTEAAAQQSKPKSDRHRQGARVDCVCQICGKEFSIPPAWIRKGGGKYCGKVCATQARYQGFERICKGCGKEFRRRPGKDDKYCSRECYTGQWTDLTCPICRKAFRIYTSQLKKSRNHFCSEPCAIAARTSPLTRNQRRMYRGPNWGVQRKLAYERDGGRCQICKMKPRKGKRQFQVHHIEPLRLFNGDFVAGNDLSNLITLCHKCHPRAERGLLPVPRRLF